MILLIDSSLVQANNSDLFKITDTFSNLKVTNCGQNSSKMLIIRLYLNSFKYIPSRLIVLIYSYLDQSNFTLYLFLAEN